MPGSDDHGRAQRKELELLQGRLKEAQQDLEVPHTEGYPEELKRLLEETLCAQTEAVMLEREARDTAHRLAASRHDVEEAERQLLAPRTKSSVSPVTVLWTFVSVITSVILFGWVLTEGKGFTGYLVMGLLGAVSSSVLAWVYRRRLSGGGTFRTPS